MIGNGERPKINRAVAAKIEDLCACRVARQRERQLREERSLLDYAGDVPDHANAARLSPVSSIPAKKAA